MSYENAPATKMLATHCACCARPLVDAASVEAGVGPDCRKKHGFNDAQGEPDFAAANLALQNYSAFEALPDAPPGEDKTVEARRLVNALVHRIALEQRSEDVYAATNAIRALGFSKLADVIARRLAHVVIERQGGELVVRTLYSPEVVTAFRKVPGRRYDSEVKRNRFPESSARALFAALRECFPGRTVAGPKGVFVLA